MPVTAPTATTTEAAATMVARRATRLRSALRAARRCARKPDTYHSPGSHHVSAAPGHIRASRHGRVPPFWGCARPGGDSDQPRTGNLPP